MFIFGMQKRRNLLRLLPSGKKRARRRWIIGLSATIGGLLIAVSVVGLLSYPKINQALAFADQAKLSLEQAERQLVAQDFDSGRASLADAQLAIGNAKQIFYSFSWVKYIPLVRTQYLAADYIFQGVDHVLLGTNLLIDVTEGVLTPFRNSETTSISSMTDEDRRTMLQSLIDAQPQIHLIETEFEEAARMIDRIPERGLLGKVKTAIAPIKEQIPRLQETISHIVPLSQSLPSLLGYPEQKNYLLLFQNNTELRPSGGFIGTYGIIKVKDAEITSLTSDNVYNLDEAALKNGLAIDPPGPLYQYNNVSKWFLRDSNWSPDFSISAQKAIEFYHLEDGPEQQLDGVIAIDPTFINSLLSISGPITVRGITFTDENFVDKLQQHVTQGYQSNGIESSDRKDIIGELGDVLMESIFSLPKTRWPELFVALEKNLGEKHFLFWMRDQVLQDVLTKQNWTGTLTQDTNRNDLLIVDANLASLKTDPAVSRSTSYQLTEDEDGYIVTIKRTYTNTGKLNWKTTRYRTYTRMYVPQESTLVSSSGQMIDCKVTQEGVVETSEDLQHTVFAFFICIEPGEEKSVTISYRLPDRFLSSKNLERFGVSILKQPGTVNQQLSLEANFLQSIKYVTPAVDNASKISDTQTSLTQPLDRDEHFEFAF